MDVQREGAVCARPFCVNIATAVATVCQYQARAEVSKCYRVKLIQLISSRPWDEKCCVNVINNIKTFVQSSSVPSTHTSEQIIIIIFNEYNLWKVIILIYSCIYIFFFLLNLFFPQATSQANIITMNMMIIIIIMLHICIVIISSKASQGCSSDASSIRISSASR